MNQIAMPHLSIADTESILPYEWQSVESARSEEDGQLRTVRHPFPVTPLDESNYLLLGDADEFHELVAEGLEYLPVQICPSEQIVIENLPVGVVRFTYEDLVRFVGRHSETVAISESSAGDGILPVGFEFEDRQVRLALRDSTRTGCPTPLDQLFREIARIGRFVPALDRRSRRDGLTRTSAMTGRLKIPNFDLDDLKAAARAERLFPPETIHCHLRRRVLHIDFPVEVLTSNISLTEKQQYLSELIALRYRSLRTSFYDGQIFLLNR